MARPRSFDRDTVLDHAVATFWRQGYVGTSIDDLVAATGLGRGSLYAAFGDKRGLFDAALERYGAVVSARTFAPLTEPDADLGAVARVFARLAKPDLEAPAPGCLITNTVCESAPFDPELRARVRLALDGLEAKLAAALQRARLRGQLAATLDPASGALFLVSVAQGLRVLARAGEPAARLAQVASTALAAVRNPSTPDQPRTN